MYAKKKDDGGGGGGGGAGEAVEVIPELYTKAVSYACEAMDILEFRLGTRMRDGRSGENPISSLFELTAEEMSFLSVLVMTGEDIRSISFSTHTPRLHCSCSIKPPPSLVCSRASHGQRV